MIEKHSKELDVASINRATHQKQNKGGTSNFKVLSILLYHPIIITVEAMHKGTGEYTNNQAEIQAIVPSVER